MQQIKTLFISDVHLGSRHSSTHSLLEFLTTVKREHTPEKLYIIGDFIDGWKLQRNWYWNNESNLIIRKIFNLLRAGTEVFYIAGNHDEFLRSFIDDFHIGDFGSIHIGNEFIHETADGKKLMIIHGDVFDVATKYARWLCILGMSGYDFLLMMNKFVKRVCRFFGFKQWSLSKSIKANVKQAINFIGNFEKCLIDYGKQKKCDGCVCGHIHTPELRYLEDGFIYANSGDFVESCTAIYEDYNGKLHLYHHGEGIV